MTTSFRPVESYVPHRGAMLLIDRLLDAGPTHAVAEVTVPADGLFVWDGRAARLGGPRIHGAGHLGVVRRAAHRRRWYTAPRHAAGHAPLPGACARLRRRQRAARRGETRSSWATTASACSRAASSSRARSRHRPPFHLRAEDGASILKGRRRDCQYHHPRHRLQPRHRPRHRLAPGAAPGTTSWCIAAAGLDEAEAVAAEVRALGREARVLQFDVADRAAASAALLKPTWRRTARYYGVVCNAGITARRRLPGTDAARTGTR